MDAQEIEQAYRGRPGARRALSERLRKIIHVAVARRLYPIARSSGREPRQELEDFVNGVFLALLEDDWRVLRRYDPSQGSLESYVSVIATRHVIDAFRVKRRDPYAELPVGDQGVLEHRRGAGEDLERRVRARSELDELHAYLRERLDARSLALFHMLFVEGKSVEHVCEALELSKQAVYKRRSRIKQDVRQWRCEREASA